MTSRTASPPASKAVHLFSSDPALIGEVTAAFASLSNYRLAASEASAFGRGAKDAVAFAAVLDLGDGELLDQPGFEEEWARWRTVPVVVVSGQLSQDRIRKLVRLKAADWLQRPLKTSELIGSIGNISGVDSPKTGRVTTFTGASGGSGVTTLALMAAKRAAQIAGSGRVALVDLNFQSADCGAYLNIINDFNLEDVVKNPARLDAELVNQIRLETEAGISLFSMERPTLAHSPGGRDFVLRLLDLIAYGHDEIIIDLPYRYTPWLDDVIAASDQILVVFEANVPSLRQARGIIDSLKDTRGDSGGVEIIVNKFSPRLFGNVISQRDIAKVFKQRRVPTLVREDSVLAEAMNRGQFAADVNSGAKFVKQSAKLLGQFFSKEKVR